MSHAAPHAVSTACRLVGGIPFARLLFFFHHTPPPALYTLSLHDALPICPSWLRASELCKRNPRLFAPVWLVRSEEHTSELQSRRDLVCRLLLEKKKTPQLFLACVSGKHFKAANFCVRRAGGTEQSEYQPV